MKKLKRTLMNARSAMSVKTHKKPRLFIILTMLMINVLILVVAALIAMAIDDSFSGFIDAFAHGSVLWLLTPNAILELEQPSTLFLAVAVLITGLVLFTGTIIALATNALKDYFDRKRTTSGKVYLQKHILILNWNSKVPELVADLQHIKSRNVKVLILAEVDKRLAEQALRNALKKSGKKDELKSLDVLVKSGNPLSKIELLESSIDTCETVIVMNKKVDEVETERLGKSDLNIIKILLSIGHLGLSREIPIVAEVKDIETKEKVRTINQSVASLKSYRLIPICFDRRLGQIMAQTIIQKDIEDVYLELFSFSGSEIYPLDGVSFEDCMRFHTHAIPIEAMQDYLYVLASSNAEKNHRDERLSLKKETVKTNPFHLKVVRDVYIIGDNNKRQFIEEAFAAYERLHGSSFQATWWDEDDLDGLLREVDAKEKPATLLLLSEETEEEEKLDANVINNLLYIETHLKRNDVRVIVELLDPKNDPLIKDFDIENTIISNKIISLLLSKLALHPRSEQFYEDLLSIEPYESGKDEESLHIESAEAALDESFPYRFASVKSMVHAFYEAYEEKAVLIGTIKGDNVSLFGGDMTKTPFTLQASDKLIFLKFQ